MEILGYHMPALLGVAAASTTAFVSTLGAFSRFDKDQSDENREFVREWIVGLHVDLAKWDGFFAELFGSFFGSKHLSLKCARRSVLLSLSIFAAIMLVWYIQTLGRLPSRIPGDALAWVVGSSFLMVCIIDYLSLWKTRFILTRIKQIGKWFGLLGVVTGDVLATVGLFFIAVILNSAALDFIFNGWYDPYLTAKAVSGSLLFTLRQPIGPTLNTTKAIFLVDLLTSAWLWAYLIGAYSIRAINLIPKCLGPVSTVMDFAKHPVRTIGYFAATAVAAIVGLLALL